MNANQPHKQQPTSTRPAKPTSQEQDGDDDIDPELARLDKSNLNGQNDEPDDRETDSSDMNDSINGDGIESQTERTNRKATLRAAHKKCVRWAGYVWRRGMVPLWWQILVCHLFHLCHYSINKLPKASVQ